MCFAYAEETSGFASGSAFPESVYRIPVLTLYLRTQVIVSWSHPYTLGVNVVHS